MTKVKNIVRAMFEALGMFCMFFTLNFLVLDLGERRSAMHAMIAVGTVIAVVFISGIVSVLIDSYHQKKLGA